MPGFEHFLTATPCSELQAAARGGSVVIVNLSSYRCDALIVTTDDVAVVPLARLTPLGRGGPDERAPRCATTGRGRWRGGGIGTADPDLRRHPGLAVAYRRRTRLGGSRPHGSLEGESWPRLWWCPTGPLTLLPLHAAASADGSAAVLDRVVSSYTPTLASIAPGRHRRTTAGRRAATGRRHAQHRRSGPAARGGGEGSGAEGVVRP